MCRCTIRPAPAATDTGLTIACPGRLGIEDVRDFVVSDLRAQPRFLADVADRIWRAWWREDGLPLETLRRGVEQSLVPGVVPTALVAHRGDLFLGTASLIDNDMEQRPLYRPWVAAVWVEAEQRGRGIGAALVETAATVAFAGGVERVYLCAAPRNAAFYERLGWLRIEADVAGLDIFHLLRPG